MLSLNKIAIVYFQCQGFDYLLNTRKDHFYVACFNLEIHFTFAHHWALFIVPLFYFPFLWKFASICSPNLWFCVALTPQFVHSPPLDHHNFHQHRTYSFCRIVYYLELLRTLLVLLLLYCVHASYFTYSCDLKRVSLLIRLLNR